MAGLAGIVLVGRVNAAFPLAGLDFDLDAIAACIIGGASFMGGAGSIWGTLIGAMIISVLSKGHLKKMICYNSTKYYPNT